MPADAEMSQADIQGVDVKDGLAVEVDLGFAGLQKSFIGSKLAHLKANLHQPKHLDISASP